MSIFGAVYDDEPLPLVGNLFSCAGNESSLLDCPFFVLHDPPLHVQATDHITFNIVGVRCDGEYMHCFKIWSVFFVLIFPTSLTAGL